MAVTREQVSQALYNLLVGSYAYAYTSRRLENISNQLQMPALFLEEMPEKHVREKMPSPARRILEYIAWVYINVGLDLNTIPMTTLNNIIDTIDPVTGGVLKPNDLQQNRQTLGGLVYDCYIEGELPKVPGDVDGIGGMRIPIKVIFN